MSEVPAPESLVLILILVLAKFSEGMSADVFVEKLRDVEVWLFRCGFGDPTFVAVDVDVGHGEGFGGETEGVSH